MRICHCNDMTDDVVNQVIAQQLEEISAASCLLEGVGLLWREAMNKAPRDHINPFSCTTCFNTLARTLQEKHNLFAGETLPDRNRKDCNACPRRAECRINFAVH